MRPLAKLYWFGFIEFVYIHLTLNLVNLKALKKFLNSFTVEKSGEKLLLLN